MTDEVVQARREYDEEYQQAVKEGRHEYECVIVLKGRSAYEAMACGEDDLKYLIDEGQFVAQAHDIKSIKFYDKTAEKEASKTRRIVGKGVFDGIC